jgi:hypothetical protein
MSNAIVQVGPIEKSKTGKSTVRATLGGSFSSDDVGLIKGWAEGLSSAIKDEAKGKNKSVSILINITSLETYGDPAIITILSELMKGDDPFVYKTATYGGKPLHEMIQDVIESMAGRNNLKNFKTENEALAWLAE